MGDDPSLWTTLAENSFTFWGLMAASAKLAIYLSSFLAAGILLFLVMLPVSNEGLRRELLRWAAFSTIIGALASSWRVMVQAGRLMDDAVFMTDPEIIMIVLDGPLGTSTLVRLVGLVIIVLSIFFSGMRTPGTFAGALLVALSFALTGHATRDPQWSLTILITVHLLAVSYWFGALLPLYRLAGSGQDHHIAADMSHRFGQQATFIVPVLILVGASFAYLLTGGVDVLIGSAYGQMLIVKLLLVAMVLGIAGLNKLRLVPALKANQDGAANQFRLSLRWETFVFVLIFFATALLTTSFTVPGP